MTVQNSVHHPIPQATTLAYGAVVIGRNEGDRLRRCFESLMRSTAQIVYVDSGSTDDSVALASQLQLRSVALDLSLPFTAARARNAGLAALRAWAPELNFVFFIDGDCEVKDGWMGSALEFLAHHPETVSVCGRLRERRPEASVYNRLCDIEWSTPPGPAKACGGIAVFRIAPLVAVGGFREDLIAGEEPELCVRLRQAGWTVWRLADEMALHDAAMTQLSQWWRRAKRGGHAAAEGAFLHGAPPERHGVAATRRALLWGLLLPVATALAGLLLHPAAWLLLLAYPLQVLRLSLRYGAGTLLAWQRGFFMVLARFPEAAGVLQFHGNRLRQRRSALIEYK
ncbi:MAG: hypothetical protein RLZZ401_503 [Pseudomonadota bacterium]|jgi:GT2 family glycosyltransferase